MLGEPGSELGESGRLHSDRPAGGTQAFRGSGSLSSGWGCKYHKQQLKGTWAASPQALLVCLSSGGGQCERRVWAERFPRGRAPDLQMASSPVSSCGPPSVCLCPDVLFLRGHRQIA